MLLLTKGKDISTSKDNILLSDAEDSKVDFSAWRERVRHNADAFIDLCADAGLCPDLWSLYEWFVSFTYEKFRMY